MICLKRLWSNQGIKSEGNVPREIISAIMCPLWLLLFCFFLDSLVIFVPTGWAGPKRGEKKRKGQGGATDRKKTKKKREEEEDSVWVGGVRMEGGGGMCVFGLGVGGGFRWASGKRKKKKDKLQLVPLFLHPSDVPFLLVVWKTLTPRRHPPFCYLSHTCQPRSASQSPAQGQMAWPRFGPNDPKLRDERGWLWRGSHLAINMKNWHGLFLCLTENTPC